MGDVSGEFGSIVAQFGHLVVPKNCAVEKAVVTVERIKNSSLLGIEFFLLSGLYLDYFCVKM